MQSVFAFKQVSRLCVSKPTGMLQVRRQPFLIAPQMNEAFVMDIKQ